MQLENKQFCQPQKKINDFWYFPILKHLWYDIQDKMPALIE